MTKYGILDDFGAVIRWTFDKPVGRAFIAVKVPKPRKLSAYQLAIKNSEPAPF